MNTTISKYVVFDKTHNWSFAYSNPGKLTSSLRRKWKTIVPGNFYSKIKKECDFIVNADGTILHIRHITGPVKITRVINISIDQGWIVVPGRDSVPASQEISMYGKSSMISKPINEFNDIYHCSVKLLMYIIRAKQKYTVIVRFGFVIPYYSESLDTDNDFFDVIKNDFEKTYDISTIRRIIYPFLAKTDPKVISL